jgi:L-rhamnose mutarotase
MLRYGSVLKVRDVEKYKELHRNVPQAVKDALKKAHIKNYSIFLKDDMLFSYYEYTGIDHDGDFEKMKCIPEVAQWWDICMPLQVPLDTRKAGEWWAFMESVFFLE